MLMFDVQPQTVERAHVDVRDPDQREPADQVSAPACVQQRKARDQQKERRHIVREAVLAREQIEELPCGQWAAVLSLALAELARLAEDLLVRDGPTDGR